MARKRNLHDQLVDELGRAIASGSLAPGTVLPSEGDLAAERGVSRTVAREALKSLAARGMVRARPRAGTRVLPSEEWSCLDSDVIRWRLTGQDRLQHLKALLELRLLVDPAAAALAAGRADARRREAIWLIYEELEAARDDHGAWIDASGRLHALIFEGCGNELVAGLGAQLRSAILESRQLTRPTLDRVPPDLAAPYASPVDEALARYRAIAAAIRDQDPVAAEKEMRAILLRLEELFDYLGAEASEEGGR